MEIFLISVFLFAQVPAPWDKYMENGVAFVLLGWFMWRMEKVLSKLTVAVDRNTKATLLSTIEVSQVDKAREQAESLLDELRDKERVDK